MYPRRRRSKMSTIKIELANFNDIIILLLMFILSLLLCILLCYLLVIKCILLLLLSLCNILLLLFSLLSLLLLFIEFVSSGSVVMINKSALFSQITNYTVINTENTAGQRQQLLAAMSSSSECYQ